MSLRIMAPYWTRPALLDSSRTFQVTLRSLASTAPTIALTSVSEAIPVCVEGAAPLPHNVVTFACTALGGKPGQMYDLRVHVGSQSATMPNAVSVLPQDTTTLSVLHCSDLHLLKPTPDSTLEDRCVLIAALVAHINLLDPDLVVCTGDLVSRYDPDKRALSSEQIRWQIRRVKEILLGIRVPLFVTLGNHDAAFEATRPDWYTAMGGGWKGYTDDYSLDWGPYHLVMMDCFTHYDPQNIPLESSFTAEQIQWLRQDLLAASASQLRLVFAHYDYHEHLPRIMEEGSLDLLFYGHAKGLYPQVLAENTVWDGHLADTQAYNLVHLTPRGIVSERVPWTNLVT